jgi:hypothetical protein
LGKRRALTKKTRFEVFKRDAFTCQYCGQSAPQVVLEVDHIHPVAEGGGNELVNLATACRSCNSGKGARMLSDKSVVNKQMEQLKELQERKEQLEMLASWRQGLVDHAQSELEVFENFIEENYGIGLNEVGRKAFARDIKKYGLSDILEATEKSANQYLIDEDDDAQQNKFLDYIPRICYWQKRERENPVENELRRIAYMAQKFWFRSNPKELQHRLIFLHSKEEVPIDFLRSAVSSSSGIMQFEDKIREYFEDDNG